MRRTFGPGLAALVLLLPLFGSPTADSPAPPGHARPPAVLLAPDPSVSGGSLFICVASGVLFGTAVLMGNALGAAGAAVSAIHNGCI